MNIGIIQFPGSNCERETMLAVKRAGMTPVPFLWNEPIAKLQEFAGYIIIGGFSYEDRSRAGIIAALDPVMQTIKAQSELGKPILGICNGAQILVETGLVPGLENHKVGMALTENKRIQDQKILGTGYYNAWIHMRLSDDYQCNAFTRHLTPRDILHVPIAHGEGRFVMTDVLWQEIAAQGQHLFQYCDATGQIIDRFPINPNGSMHNLAAVSNKAGNVLAMMPHPERTVNGDAIFQSMHDYIQDLSEKPVTTPLYYYPRKDKLHPHQPTSNSKVCVVELMITDNQALTVQQTLRNLGLPVTVKRQTYWEVQGADDALMQRIKQSGVLFNDRKEREVGSTSHATPDDSMPRAQDPSNSKAFLVRAKEDLQGREKLQTLKDHFGMQTINAIHHGILWHFSSETANIADLMDNILSTQIIYNPYAHDCSPYNE